MCGEPAHGEERSGRGGLHQDREPNGRVETRSSSQLRSRSSNAPKVSRPVTWLRGTLRHLLFSLCPLVISEHSKMASIPKEALRQFHLDQWPQRTPVSLPRQSQSSPRHQTRDRSPTNASRREPARPEALRVPGARGHFTREPQRVLARQLRTRCQPNAFLFKCN